MLVEQSFLLVKPGLEDAFDRVMQDQGLPLLQALDGVHGVQFGRGVEHPDKFILMIRWDSMDAHIGFTQQPAFADFRAILAPFTAGGSMEHFVLR